MPASKKPAAKLSHYHRKRRASATPEPMGGSTATVGRARRFVIQKHSASKMHYDLRLEIGGTYASWAVPKGPSPDPDVKRLAVQVEDHPLSYGTFEGTIPAGNYGAGSVIVWDCGHYQPHDNPEAAARGDKLIFSLWGYKVRGLFELIRTKEGKQWLLFKKRDGYARAGQSYNETSIYSGLDVEERPRLSEVADSTRALAKSFGAKSNVQLLAKTDLMLAERREFPFRDKHWLFEPKYDGYRVLLEKRGDDVRLRLRNGGYATSTFPEFVAAAKHLPARSCILDGELIVTDHAGRPSFSGLQQRFAEGSNSFGTALWATLMVFDVLALDDLDLRPLALTQRKHVLSALVPAFGPVRRTDYFVERGDDLFAATAALGLEGIVAKDMRAPYRGGRQTTWLKIKRQQTVDLVITGFRTDKPGSKHIRALHLGGYTHDGKVLYAGRAGSGISSKVANVLFETLAPLRTKLSPKTLFAEPTSSDVVVEPKIVCELKYTEWTDAGHLRHPVFLRLRTDKKPTECLHPHATLAESPPAAPPIEKTFVLTNPNKVLWPAIKGRAAITKHELVDYYEAIAPHMLVYTHERPLVLTRYPDGIDGKSFFQKNAAAHTPEWMRTEKMWSEHAQREIDYFVCGDAPSLRYLGNLAAIVLHVWASRLATLAQPDWCILDFDPKGAPFADVVTLTLATRKLCQELGLASYVKTSGGTGLHVLIPTGRLLTFDQTQTFAGLLAQALLLEHADIATTARALRQRQGKVYIDTLQNGHGKLLVAPYSPRANENAQVSTPLEWDEVGPKLRLDEFTLRTATKRLQKKRCPLTPILEDTPDLFGALQKLSRLLEPKKCPQTPKSLRASNTKKEPPAP